LNRNIAILLLGITCASLLVPEFTGLTYGISDERIISVTISTSTENNSSLKIIGTTGSVHIFTPNASTTIVEAEEVQVEVIVHNPESSLEKNRSILIFSGAFIVAAILIILRYKTRARQNN